MDFRESFRAMHPFTKMLMLVLLMLISTVVVVGLSMFAAMPFFGKDAMTMLGGGAMDSSSVHIMRYFQVMSHIGLFIVPAIVFALIMSGRPAEYLQMNRNPGFRAMLLGTLIIFATVPLVSYLTELNHLISFPEFLKPLETWMLNAESSAEKMTRYFLEVESWKGLMFNVLMIAIIPAFGEEFIFRGILQKLFAKWTRSHHIAVLITAILFSAMHLQFFSFLPRFFLGLILGYMLVWSGHLWVPVLAHFVNNLAALLFYYYHDRGAIAFDLEEIGQGRMAPVLVAGSIIIILLLFVAFRRQAVPPDPDTSLQ